MPFSFIVVQSFSYEIKVSLLIIKFLLLSYNVCFIIDISHIRVIYAEIKMEMGVVEKTVFF